jgi:Uma2 family endonuclease
MVPPTTFDDFCALVKDGEKGDLINGVIYVPSPENTDANSIAGWVYWLMSSVAEAKEAGEVYFSRVAFRLDETNGPEPDVAFVQKSRLHLVQRGYVDGPPDLAVEVVSPDSVERDYEKKRKLYEQAGVREYWIIDEIEQKVMLLRLGPNGKFREVRPKQGKLHSTALPGFWIRPEWLWPDTRPKKLDAFNEIMSAK